MIRLSFLRASILVSTLVVLGLVSTACPAAPAASPTAAPTKPAAAATTAATTAAATTAAATTAAATTAAAAPTQATAPAKPTKEAVKVGIFFDASGPTSNIGPKLRDGAKDWIDYVNAAKGGVNGHPITGLYEDNKYEVPTSVNIYKRWLEQEKVVAINSYGTPITEALSPSAAKDHVPLLTPGYGLSASSDGTKYPYTYVGVASYNAQMAAILQWIKNNWKGAANPKVGYMYYDNPAGQDPVDLMHTVSKKLGIDVVKEVPVPPTAVDTTSQQLELQKGNPDFVISHLFGRLPGISIKDRGRLGIKTPYISLVWGISEDEIQVGGDAAEGYQGVQFSALPDDKPEALQAIAQWYQSQGKPLPANFNSVFYARGVLTAALIEAGVAAGGDPVNGESVKKGLESLKAETLFGMSPGLTITPTDHGGTNKVRMYKVQNGKLVMVQDWFEGPMQ